MATILDAMMEYFRSQSWPFEKAPDEPELALSYLSGTHRLTCLAQAREEQQQFLFYSVAPITLAPERRGAAMELLTRINQGMVIGNFELDLDDGEVRYKTSVDVGELGLSRPLIRPVVHLNLLMMEKYLPGLLKVADGSLQPIQAIDLCEKDD